MIVASGCVAQHVSLGGSQEIRRLDESTMTRGRGDVTMIRNGDLRAGGVLDAVLGIHGPSIGAEAAG
jgi:hypothetical protein